NPTVLGRKGDEEIAELFHGQGYEPHFVVGDDVPRVHAAFAETLVVCHDRIVANRKAKWRARWPMIVLRTPKGWTGPDKVDGVQVQGTFRAHQVPLAGVRENPEHLRMPETWMKSYKPEELFDDRGRPVPMLAALAPKGDLRMG